ncbi:MAG: histidine--tRNA ligase [Saprospiraceae bacterium]
MKPSIPKGTRDFLPAQIRKRKYIFDIIESAFKTFGYLPIETPTLENLSTLTGKYGVEGDKLLFKVLNNGDFLADAHLDDLQAKNSNKVLPTISKRGLRYDLTVPFARFVVMHQNDITFPFKRYQIQPVWRADRPQRGRYQEFYQCDADVVGSSSLMYEAELVQIYASVLNKLNIKSKILINNRKILLGIAELSHIPDQFMDMTMAIDKLDKIGFDGVKKELADRDIPENAISMILKCLSCTTLDELSELFGDNSIGAFGIKEVNNVLEYLSDSVANVSFDITLARGLNYYTGCIFEVKVDESHYPGFKMGSIGGGGRYDDLTGVFGLKNVSGVGISFGAERMYDVMEELNLFPEDLQKDVSILLIGLDEKAHMYAFNVISKLRQNGIQSDLYPEPSKLKKQMAYANARNVPYVGIIGADEMENHSITLKNMISGDQEIISIDDLIQMFS